MFISCLFPFLFPFPFLFLFLSLFLASERLRTNEWLRCERAVESAKLVDRCSVWICAYKNDQRVRISRPRERRKGHFRVYFTV